jgi:hypothetical protein
MAVVPERDADVHDLRGLKEVGESLLAEARQRAGRQGPRAPAARKDA